MSLGSSSSANTIRATDFVGSSKQANPQPMSPPPTGNIPADHSDPNHPHNGDIESQSNVQEKKFGMSRRAACTLSLFFVFLSTLCAAFGMGWYHGRHHGGNTSPVTSTLTHFTTVESTVIGTATDLQTIIGTTTVTTHVTVSPTTEHHSPLPATDTVPFNTPILAAPSKTADAPPLPPESKPKESGPSCLTSGHFKSKQTCLEHCGPIEGRTKLDCAPGQGGNGAWMCVQCYP